MTATELKKRAIALAEKTKIDSVTPEEVGQLSNDIVEYIENVELNGSSLGIRKTYTSVSAMEEDSTAPKDDKGVLLRRGMLVNIYNQSDPESADNGKVFSFQNPGWAFRGTVDAGYATKEELTELVYHQNNELSSIIKNSLIISSDGTIANASNILQKIHIFDVENHEMIFLNVEANNYYAPFYAFAFSETPVDDINTGTSTLTEGRPELTQTNTDFSFNGFLTKPKNAKTLIVQETNSKADTIKVY